MRSPDRTLFGKDYCVGLKSPDVWIYEDRLYEIKLAWQGQVRNIQRETRMTPAKKENPADREPRQIAKESGSKSQQVKKTSEQCFFPGKLLDCRCEILGSISD